MFARSHFDFLLLFAIKQNQLASLNKGVNRFDLRRRFACGHVSLAIMKYIHTMDESELKIKYHFKPLEFREAYSDLREQFDPRSKNTVVKFNNTTLARVESQLLTLGAGASAMLGVDYDTTKSSGRIMGGLVAKSWGHWFVMLNIGQKVFCVDAYSKNTFVNSQFIKDYLNDYKPDGVECIIHQPNKRRGMIYE